MAQDLELSTKKVPKRVSQDVEETNIEDTQDAALTPDLYQSTQSRSTPRGNDTYKKDEYLSKVLRRIYYQNITTPIWLKYFDQRSWKKRVLSWRHHDQLKKYITGNSHQIIVLRSAHDEDLVEINTDDDRDSSEIAPSIELTAEEYIVPDSCLIPDEKIIVISKKIERTKNEVDEIAATQKTATDPVGRSPSTPTSPTSPPIEASNEGSSSEETPHINTTISLSKDDVSAPPANENKPDNPPPINNNTEPTVTVKPPPKSQSTYSPGKTGSGPFKSMLGRLPWPVRGGRVTDRFGIRRNAEARGLKPENYGIDMICPKGSRIAAVHDGTVLIAKRQSPNDIIVTIKHGDFTTAYYYLISSKVKTGDVVKAGQEIGQLRTNGTEADFHFEIWNNQDRVDPERWLSKR